MLLPPTPTPLIRGISFSPFHKSQTKKLTELHRTEALPRPRVGVGEQDVKSLPGREGPVSEQGTGPSLVLTCGYIT